MRGANGRVSVSALTLAGFGHKAETPFWTLETPANKVSAPNTLEIGRCAGRCLQQRIANRFEGIKIGKQLQSSHCVHADTDV